MNHYKQFIDSLSQKRANYNDAEQAFSQAQALHLLSKDIYTDSKRFIYELLQNADDASNSKNNLDVSIHFLDNYLIVAHKGEAFTEIDIESLSSTGDGVKSTQAKKTGFKGIGFKSVFNHSDYVIIKSGGYSFRFDLAHWTENNFSNTWKSAWGSMTDWQAERKRKGLDPSPKMPWQMIPIWTELPQEISSLPLFNEYSVCTIIRYKSKNDIKTLEESLTKLFENINLILFLRCQNTKITINKNHQNILTIEKHFDEISKTLKLTKNGSWHSEWLMKNQNFLIEDYVKVSLQTDDKAPQRLKEATETDLQFVIPLKNGRISSVSQNDRIIFTYLPTSINFDFPFLLNGSFLTDAGREKLHTNNDWNNFLFKKVAFHFFEWIAELAHKNSPYNKDFLTIIPNRLDSLNPFCSSFNDSYDEAINKIAFLPNLNGDLFKVGESILDETRLSTFIDKQTIINFINDNTSKYTINSFLQTLNPTDTLKKLGVFFFEIESLTAFFKSDVFKNQHNVNDNFGLIEFLYKQSSLTYEKEKWSTSLQKIAFIFDEKTQLHSPQAIYFPTIATTNQFSGEISTIHPEVAIKIQKDSDIKNWLNVLGVKEISDISFIEKTIIGQGDTFVTKQNAIEVGKYLFKVHSEGKLTNSHYTNLTKLKLITKQGSLVSAEDSFLADLYEPVLTLEKVFANDFYVSEKYIGVMDNIRAWTNFFIKIGVKQDIGIINQIINLDGNVSSRFDGKLLLQIKNTVSKYSWVSSQGWSINGNGFGLFELSISVYSIPFLQFANNYSFAKLYINRVFAEINPHDHKLNDAFGVSGITGRIGYHEYRRYISHEQLGYFNCPVKYFNWVLNNVNLFPTTQKTSLKMSDVYSSSIPQIAEIAGKYLPVFDCEVPIPTNWAGVLKFKEVLKLEDYLTILSGIANDKSVGENQKNENQKTSVIGV